MGGALWLGLGLNRFYTYPCRVGHSLAWLGSARLGSAQLCHQPLLVLKGSQNGFQQPYGICQLFVLNDLFGASAKILAGSADSSLALTGFAGCWLALVVSWLAPAGCLQLLAWLAARFWPTLCQKWPKD